MDSKNNLPVTWYVIGFTFVALFVAAIALLVWLVVEIIKCF